MSFLKVDLDLFEVKVCSSETLAKGSYLYDKFSEKQGEELDVMFLDFDDPFHGKVWMPDSESNLGIVEVAHPYGMSDMFFSHITPDGIAYTDGEFPYFEKRFSC